jgi:predicted nucleotidyltransferase
MTFEGLLQTRREEILRVCARYGAHVRIFGTVARGEADNASTLLSDLQISFNSVLAYLTNRE